MVRPPNEWLKKTGSTLENLKETFAGDGVAINSREFRRSEYDRVQGEDHRPAGIDGAGSKTGSTPSSAIGCSAAQRYWGEPIPDSARVAMPMVTATGLLRTRAGKRPACPPAGVGRFQANRLARRAVVKSRPTGWSATLDGKKYRRETNTMPQWAGSCWYYLRYLDPKNDSQLVPG